MNLSHAKPFLSEIESGDRIPEHKFAYLEQRTLNNFFEYLITKFENEKEKRQFTKAKLAERIGRSPAQINRWLATPSNLTIQTLTRLLVGIAGEEPELTSRSLLGRLPRNESWETILNDQEDYRLPKPTPSPATTKVIEQDQKFELSVQ